MIHGPATYRLRTLFIRQKLGSLPVNKKFKNDPRNLLTQGYIDESLQEEYEAFLINNSESNEPLRFDESGSYATWFAMHPDKVAGPVKVTTSFHFPLKVDASKADVIAMLDKAISSSNQPNRLLKMKLKARAAKAKMKLRGGLAGINQMPFPKSLVKAINEQSQQSKRVLELSKTSINGLGSIVKNADAIPLLSFEQIQERYNKGISDSEIKAWVWFKRNLGIPMYGWEQYFIDNAGSGVAEDQLRTKVETTIKDNHFRDVMKVKRGVILGKKLKKSHTYSGITYQFFRDSEGIKMANVADVDIIKTAFKTDKKKINSLVSDGALFYHDGELLPFPIYAYANMYDRELQLRKDADAIIESYGEDIYEAHADVIQKHKPKVISFQNPDIRERPKLLAISKHARDRSWFAVSSLREEYSISFAESQSLSAAFEEYLEYLDKNDKASFDNLSAHEIYHYYVEGHNLGRSLGDENKTLISTYGPIEGEALFSRFLNEALTRQDLQKLDMLWNRTYNGWSNLPYHRIPIGFDCSSKFKRFDFAFTPIQREGIAFMEAAGSGIIAYDVGVGKTVTAIIALANAIKAGKCSRPVIVVPNATYVKWIREIFGYTDDKTGEFIAGVLSNTGITLNDWFNLGSKVANKVNLKTAVPANSITMLTYEGFSKLGYGQKTMNSLFDELKEILAQAEDTGDSQSQRDVEKQYQRYRELIGVGNKGSIVDIETVGFDYIVIDEAHNFKNIFSYVPTDEDGVKRFRIEASDSARAKKAFFLCNFIQRTYGSNVMLLTATPFSNNPIEVFSMLSLVAYSDMRQMGVVNLYSFMEQFVLQSLEYVNSYDGTIKQKHVVKSFNNRLVLQKLIYNNIHYKTGEEAGVKRPCKINLPRLTAVDNTTGGVKKLPKEDQLVTFLEMTAEQRINQQEIVIQAQSGDNFKQRAGNIMRALSGSLNNALSPYLYYGTHPDSAIDFIESSPKIAYTMECIRSVKQYHEEVLNDEVSGQVIYMNRGKDYFRYIKEYLQDEVGYKVKQKFRNKYVDEVEILTSSVSQAGREYVKDAFLAGACKIIIGTATIREGIDLQKKGTVIYNCYPDWNPTDLKQLEGRIHRQGNDFGYVRSVMPLVQDSMDVFVFQKLEEKTARVNDIWFRADRGNVLDVESLDPEEVKFALFTNLNELADLVISKETKLKRMKAITLEESLSTLGSYRGAVSGLDEYRAKMLNWLKNANEQLKGFEEFIEDELKEPFSNWILLSPSAIKELINRAVELSKDLDRLLSGVPTDDKLLVHIFNRLKNSQYRTRNVIRLYDRDYDVYASYLTQVAKAKRTFLDRKGYTSDTDLSEVEKALRKEIDTVHDEIEAMDSEDYRKSVIIEISRKKEENNVNGRPPKQAAEDFRELNYLLQYKFGEADINSCILPKKGMKPKDRPPVTSNTLKLRLKLKAKAARAKLKL